MNSILILSTVFFFNVISVGFYLTRGEKMPEARKMGHRFMAVLHVGSALYVLGALIKSQPT